MGSEKSDESETDSEDKLLEEAFLQLVGRQRARPNILNEDLLNVQPNPQKQDQSRPVKIPARRTARAAIVKENVIGEVIQSAPR